MAIWEPGYITDTVQNWNWTHINLLYVVMTRAVEQLYIISELDLDTKQNEKKTCILGCSSII